MKIHFWLTSALVLVSAGASADPLAVGYGNTVTQTMPDGSKTIIYVNEDKTWEQHLANGTVLKGTFVEKDEHTVCFTLVDPAPKAGEGRHELQRYWWRSQGR